jgi:hypothetical protein
MGMEAVERGGAQNAPRHREETCSSLLPSCLICILLAATLRRLHWGRVEALPGLNTSVHPSKPVHCGCMQY